MTANISNSVRHTELDGTTIWSKAPMDKVNLPRQFLDVLVRATPCSPMVFYGLLAWANLNAQSKRLQA
jgi:hypothetical protein